MKYSLKEYLDAEIPVLADKKGLSRAVAFWKARRYYPSYDAVYMIRWCYVYSEASGIKKYRRMRYKRLLVNKYNIYFNVDKSSHIGKGLFLPHPASVVFGAGVNIGDNCTVYQNVTLGAKKRAENNDKQGCLYPQIGDDCIFYAGSVVLGPIQVRNGTQVGANAVLMRDTEENSVYAGVPAVRKR